MGAIHQSINTFRATVGQLRALFSDRMFTSTLDFERKGERKIDAGMEFLFHHGVTMASWGEKITVTVRELSADEVKVAVCSECSLPTQIIDWGKNKDNVENIFGYIARNLRKYEAVADAVTEVVTEVVTEEAAGDAVATGSAAGKICGGCGKEVSADANFCGFCGAALSKCGKCGAAVGIGQKFCGSCGEKL